MGGSVWSLIPGNGQIASSYSVNDCLLSNDLYGSTAVAMIRPAIPVLAIALFFHGGFVVTTARTGLMQSDRNLSLQRVSLSGFYALFLIKEIFFNAGPIFLDEMLASFL